MHRLVHNLYSRSLRSVSVANLTSLPRESGTAAGATAMEHERYSARRAPTKHSPLGRYRIARSSLGKTAPRGGWTTYTCRSILGQGARTCTHPNLLARRMRGAWTRIGTVQQVQEIVRTQGKWDSISLQSKHSSCKQRSLKNNPL